MPLDFTYLYIIKKDTKKTWFDWLKNAWKFAIRFSWKKAQEIGKTNFLKISLIFFQCLEKRLFTKQTISLGEKKKLGKEEKKTKNNWITTSLTYLEGFRGQMHFLQHQGLCLL